MTETDKQTLRTDRGALEAALRDAGAVIRGNAARCPFHDDRHASGSIHQAADGAWRFRCHPCDITEDVIGVRALAGRRTSGDVLKAASAAAAPLRPTATARPPRVFPTVAALVDSVRAYQPVDGVWTYELDGRTDMVVIRLRDPDGGKSYRQARPNEGGGFVQQGPPKPWPLYNRTRLRDQSDDFVIVVEGEKCVHALHDLGYLATTSPGGSENAGNADWSPAGGARTVFLWADNDPPNPPTRPDGRPHPRAGIRPGAAYMDAVAEMLGKLPTPPRVLRVDVTKLGLPPKGDVVEFIAANPDDPAGAIAGVLAAADPVGPAAKVRRLVEATISGKRYAVPWPWPHLSNLTQSLLPGTITVICGDGGSTKTWFVLEATAYWHVRKIPWAMQELEEDEDGATLIRVAAQREGNGDFGQTHWITQNPDAARAVCVRSEAFLDDYGRNLWAIPGHMPSLDELVQWVRDRCREGKRVLVIDPITAADSDDKPWIADKRFLRTVQGILREHGASLVLVTHPKQSRKSATPSMDDVAGGSAYQRFTQNVFWLQRREGEDAVDYQHYIQNFGWKQDSADVNRLVRVFKARNGRWSRFDVAMQFGPDLSFCEYGITFKRATAAPRLPDLSERSRVAPPAGSVLNDFVA